MPQQFAGKRLEGEYWEFAYDSRPTNSTWSWRHVAADGGTDSKSGAFKDFGEATVDALSNGFSPKQCKYVVRGRLIATQFIPDITPIIEYKESAG